MPDITNHEARIAAIEEHLGIDPQQTLQASRDQDAAAARAASDAEWRLRMEDYMFDSEYVHFCMHLQLTTSSDALVRYNPLEEYLKAGAVVVCDDITRPEVRELVQWIQLFGKPKQ